MTVVVVVAVIGNSKCDDCKRILNITFLNTIFSKVVVIIVIVDVVVAVVGDSKCAECKWILNIT